MRISPLTQINPANVGKLGGMDLSQRRRVAGDAAGGCGVMYITFAQRGACAEPETGKSSGSMTRRDDTAGLAYWPVVRNTCASVRKLREQPDRDRLTTGQLARGSAMRPGHMKKACWAICRMRPDDAVATACIATS